MSGGIAFVEDWDSMQIVGQHDEELQDEPIEQHWDHLLQLKAGYHQLELKIQREEHHIREMLQQDCPSTLSSWKNCRSFGCRLKVSLTKAPDLIRQIRYRFGPFASSLPAGYCSECPQQDGCAGAGPTPTGQPNNSPQNAPHATATPISAPTVSKTMPTESDYSYNAQDIFTICTLVVLASAVLVYGFKPCRSTTYCRRRRADRAARREEGHARWSTDLQPQTSIKTVVGEKFPPTSIHIPS